MKLSELLTFDNIVIQGHDNPDADAIAGAYGLYLFFKSKGKKVRMIYGGSNRIEKKNLVLMLEKLDITETFLEIAKYLTKHKRLVLSEKMEWIYANTACRAAIKAGDRNTPEELIALVKELEKNPDVKYCPHGRPIWFFMSRSEMEKNFKRI